jgi:hypothetical protein
MMGKVAHLAMVAMVAMGLLMVAYLPVVFLLLM